MKKKKRNNNDILEYLSDSQFKSKDIIYNLVHVLRRIEEKKLAKKVNRILLQLADTDEQIKEIMINFMDDELPI